MILQFLLNTRKILPQKVEYAANFARRGARRGIRSAPPRGPAHRRPPPLPKLSAPRTFAQKDFQQHPTQAFNDFRSAAPAARARGRGAMGSRGLSSRGDPGSVPASHPPPSLFDWARRARLAVQSGAAGRVGAGRRKSPAGRRKSPAGRRNIPAAQCGASALADARCGPHAPIERLTDVYI